MKTLKDIDKYPIIHHTKPMCDCNCFEEIRKSAKEWLEDMKKKKEEYDNDYENIECCELSHSRGMVYDAEEFIKHFFNLEESK